MPAGSRRRVAIGLACVTLALTAWLGALDDQLRGGDAREPGIIALEFCRTPSSCDAQLAAIEARGAREALAFLLGLDYAYLLAYSTTIASMLVFLAAHLGSAPRAVGVLAWLQPVAAGLDAIENYALWRMLEDGADPTWGAIAFGCAGPKFAIVVAGLLTVLAMLVVLAVRRRDAHRG